MKIEGFFNETPEKQQVSMMIDGINQLPAQTYFYQKDSIVNTIPWSSMTWMIWGYYWLGHPQKKMLYHDLCTVFVANLMGKFMINHGFVAVAYDKAIWSISWTIDKELPFGYD